ncbi:Ig-like domain-containing protein [Mycolicibacterium goodii]|uniref:Ig-like domain-containing protein n=1 Tax=Mycolicibacterium goodii TaxID=134601 RepID=UPI001BDC11CD|nr:Ig-like domain-containing protein [Mycolicibacterium goodii]MBU8830830.1 Ig-like domain-containing protein [Mycolicibacterium goodii]
MVATASPWTTRKDLQFAARKLAVIQWPYNTPLIPRLHNPTTGALQIPDNGFVVGLHRKQRGGALSNAQTLNDIMAHGEGGPTLQIPTERRITIGVEPYETHRINLQNFWGADWSGVTPDASGGVTLPVPSLPLNMLSRVALLGRWDYNGKPAYIAWIGNRVNVSETSEQNVTDADVIGYPYTFNFQGVDEYDGEPFILDIFGPGWNDMQANANAGFGVGATSLNVEPAVLTLDLSNAEYEQLTVSDNNGIDRTAAATFTTSDEDVATVSTSGRVDAVGAGTATITATYGSLTDTCSVTVIA